MIERPTLAELNTRLDNLRRQRETWKGNAGYARTLDVEIWAHEQAVTQHARDFAHPIVQGALKPGAFYWVARVLTAARIEVWQPAMFTGRDGSGIDTWDVIGVDAALCPLVAVVGEEIVRGRV